MARRAFGGIRRLPSKRYQATYTGPDGRRHKAWTTYLVKADAEVWLRDEELLIDRGAWTPPDRRDPIVKADALTVREYAAATVRRRATRARRPLRPSTVDLYNKLLDLAILPTLGDRALVDLTPADVQRWHDSLPAGTAVDELILNGIGQYTAAADRHALPLLLAAWCALRSGEVRGLRRCDVLDDGAAVRVAQTVTRVGRGGRMTWHIGPPKTKAGVRTVAVPPHLAPALRSWADAHTGEPTGLLFPASDGVSPMGQTVLREAHKRAAERIKRPSLTLHDLRRTGATLAAQSGATVREVMRMLGHTQPGVAMLYQVADAERDRERAERMSRMVEGGDGR